MHTILGAGGAVGTLLAKELLQYNQKIRLVARNPQKVNESDELVKADLTVKAEVQKAVAGSAVVYLCAGLEYKLKVWQQQWPLVMQHVIDACIQHHARLVFIDNVYMYSPHEIPHMTEASEVDPCSEKGKVRRQLAQMILDAVELQKLDAIIARSADFYGPGVKSSMLTISVFDNFKKGKKAMWMLDAAKLH